MSWASPPLVQQGTCRVNDMTEMKHSTEIDDDQPCIPLPASTSVHMAVDGTGVISEQEKHSRKLSAESQDFEFNRLMTADINLSPGNPQLNSILDQHLMNSSGQIEQLASADELFYKGQLLPLHYNTRFHGNNTATTCTLLSHDLTPDISSSIKGQDVRFSSCRMDHAAAAALDASLFGFSRCSSFRSQSANQSSYYNNSYANYATTNPTLYRDSSCSSTSNAAADSSRDSTGSSQDYCSSSDNNHRDHHANCCNGNNVYKRRHSFIQSWKAFLSGFKKGATFNASRNGKAENSCHGSCKIKSTSINNVHKVNPSPHQGAIACVCTLKDKRSATNLTSIWPYPEKEKKITTGGVKQIGSDDAKTCTRRYDQQMQKAKYKSNGHSSWGSRWQSGYAKRPGPIRKIKATLGYGNVNSERDQVTKITQLSRSEEETWMKVGRTTCSPVLLERKLSQPSMHIPSLHVKLPSSRTFKFSTVSSSCPASVRSSPNHSGLLSPSFIVNNNISSMHELHSAVQGAIAHCKQSISATGPSSDS